jgi:hypothetical protein
MKNNEDPNLDVSDKVVLVLAMTFLFVLVLLLVGGLFVFGFTGLFQLFSVHYEKKSALIYYVLLLIPITLLFEVLTIFLVLRLPKYILNKTLITFFTFIITYLFILIPLILADEFLAGITVPIYTELIAALLLYGLDSLYQRR